MSFREGMSILKRVVSYALVYGIPLWLAFAFLSYAWTSMSNILDIIMLEHLRK